ncbi:FKBP-type peptidyl-prolyl cis-trans isomerase [Methanolobus chelungpuianus]|uniref:Peptidyl-prolyl cis-trans isomerase n=1 Tax=Methanolobus chelungpuianus TaxID=502115 RepID=A0AAE3L1G9_9EURY|nr:peptidylprolyl isomerase [Methanolobus chelungpuianus]MCQ6963068.1 peptidylprolyl isomerase [Methanolobus chelungpuianus]
MKMIVFLFLISLVVVSGCVSQDTVESGDYVTVDYTGRYENGSVFDTSIEQVAVDSGLYNPARNYEPMSIVVGDGKRIEGFDEAIIGMAVGEEKSVTIPPEKAYGNYSPDRVFSIPSEEFINANITPEVGLKVPTMLGTCTVTTVTEGNVTLDCNHQLAGETLVFTIQVISIGE